MTVEEMIATIQIQIHHVKGVEVHIVPDLPREYARLLLAYSIANSWLSANLIK